MKVGDKPQASASRGGSWRTLLHRAKATGKTALLIGRQFEAVGGYCVEKKFIWRYDLPPELTTELKRKADLGETCTITINLLELLGMVVTARVMLELTGDRPASVGDTIATRGDNMAPITWVNMCGGARDKRACLLMRMPGRLEIKGGWSHVAKLIPGGGTPWRTVYHAGREQS